MADFHDAESTVGIPQRQRGLEVEHLLDVLDELQRSGCRSYRLAEAIETTTLGAKLQMHIFRPIVQFQSLLDERSYRRRAVPQQ